MGRTEYEQACATQSFVEWVQWQPGIENTDDMTDENLPVLVDRYVGSGGEIPEGLQGRLETVRMQLQILDSCFPPEDYTFEDMMERFEEHLAQHRSVLPPGDPDSTMQVHPRRGQLLGFETDQDEDDEEE